MNENIDNMFDELRKEFPKKVYRELDLRIYDFCGNDYFIDDEFQEEIFSHLFINYEMNAVEINTVYSISVQTYLSNKKL